MTPEQQRIAIAEFCGWMRISKGTHYDNQHKTYGEPPSSFIMCVPVNRGHACTEVPDYLNDLNAMHEAEKRCLTNAQLEEDYYFAIDRNPFATAAQRAEALLRTIGKWEETNDTNTRCTCSMRTKLVGDGCSVCNPPLTCSAL